MQRSNFRLASLTRQIELAIVFSGLPNAIDNPLPLIVTEANFFIAKGKYMHYNPSFDLNPCARRVYSGSTFGRVTIDRSLPIDVIFLTAIAPRLSPPSPCQIRPGRFPFLRLPFWIRRHLSPICIRSAGVMKPRGHRQIVRNNTARFFQILRLPLMASSSFKSINR